MIRRTYFAGQLIVVGEVVDDLVVSQSDAALRVEHLPHHIHAGGTQTKWVYMQERGDIHQWCVGKCLSPPRTPFLTEPIHGLKITPPKIQNTSNTQNINKLDILEPNCVENLVDTLGIQILAFGAKEKWPL